MNGSKERISEANVENDTNIAIIERIISEVNNCVINRSSKPTIATTPSIDGSRSAYFNYSDILNASVEIIVRTINSKAHLTVNTYWHEPYTTPSTRNNGPGIRFSEESEEWCSTIDRSLVAQETFDLQSMGIFDRMIKWVTEKSNVIISTICMTLTDMGCMGQGQEYQYIAIDDTLHIKNIKSEVNNIVDHYVVLRIELVKEAKSVFMVVTSYEHHTQDRSRSIIEVEKLLISDLASKSSIYREALGLLLKRHLAK